MNTFFIGSKYQINLNKYIAYDVEYIYNYKYPFITKGMW